MERHGVGAASIPARRAPSARSARSIDEKVSIPGFFVFPWAIFWIVE